MKVEIKSSQNKAFGIEFTGIELTAEIKLENEILSRFWEGGIKINAITKRPNNSSLQLIFADLMGEK